MNIAIIAWGSLIWNPGDLSLASKWHKDGPLLPIEFARLSKNGTATLVVSPTWGTTNQTYWALSDESELTAARLGLKARERTPDLRSIGGVTPMGATVGWNHLIDTGNLVAPWLVDRDLDAAIWTGLKEKGLEEIPQAERVAWHRDLPLDANTHIEMYVRRTPAQVDTPLRRWLSGQLGWYRIPLGGEHFEDGIAEPDE